MLSTIQSQYRGNAMEALQISAPNRVQQLKNLEKPKTSQEDITGVQLSISPIARAIADAEKIQHVQDTGSIAKGLAIEWQLIERQSLTQTSANQRSTLLHQASRFDGDFSGSAKLADLMKKSYQSSQPLGMRNYAPLPGTYLL